MGNIQIRQENYRSSRRPQIFTDRKSFDLSKSEYKQSLMQRTERDYTYSPIRFSDNRRQARQNPLTQRKANTTKLNASNLEMTLQQKQNQQNLDLKKAFTKNSRYTKIQSLQTQNYPQQTFSNLSMTGRIVPNSTRGNDQQQLFSQTTRQIPLTRHLQTENALQNKEIIKKVRNFNDFLNEIKRKLKQDKYQTLTRNKSRIEKIKNNVPESIQYATFQKDNTKQNKPQVRQVNLPKQIIQKSRSTRQIEVALKLQNEKLELQKYRKLVERQLSKTHSIQNISLCTKNSGQKILTIQYQSILPYSIISKDNSKSILQKQSSVTKINSPILLKNSKNEADQKYQLYTIKNSTANKTASSRQGTMLRKLRQEYNKVMKQMVELGKTIDQYETQVEQRQQGPDILIQQKDQSQKNLNIKSDNKRTSLIKSNRETVNSFNQDYHQSTAVNPKIQKIEGLFSRLYQLQDECQSTDRYIKEAVELNRSDSKFEEMSQQNSYGSLIFQAKSFD